MEDTTQTQGGGGRTKVKTERHGAKQTKIQFDGEAANDDTPYSCRCNVCFCRCRVSRSHNCYIFSTSIEA